VCTAAAMPARRREDGRSASAAVARAVRRAAAAAARAAWPATEGQRCAAAQAPLGSRPAPGAASLTQAQAVAACVAAEVRQARSSGVLLPHGQHSQHRPLPVLAQVVLGRQIGTRAPPPDLL